MNSGFFAIEGLIPYGKVHAVEMGRPICHTPVKAEARFQWCKKGVSADMIECLRCRKLLGFPLNEKPKRV